MCKCFACAWCPWRPEEQIRCPETGIMDGECRESSLVLWKCSLSLSHLSSTHAFKVCFSAVRERVIPGTNHCPFVYPQGQGCQSHDQSIKRLKFKNVCFTHVYYSVEPSTLSLSSFSGSSHQTPSHTIHHHTLYCPYAF